MIKAIIFDLGRVLVSIDFLQGLLGYIGVTGSLDIGKLAENKSFLDFSTGRISSHEFYLRAIAEYDIELEYAEFCELWCNIFSPAEGMEELVGSLAGRYALGLLSDTDTLHWNHIIKHNPWIKDYFTNPVLSYEIGVMKPDRRAFECAVASVGASPGECLFIDDLQRNVSGAEAAGLNALLFQGKGKLIENLSDFGIKI